MPTIPNFSNKITESSGCILLHLHALILSALQGAGILPSQIPSMGEPDGLCGAIAPHAPCGLPPATREALGSVICGEERDACCGFVFTSLYC